MQSKTANLTVYQNFSPCLNEYKYMHIIFKLSIFSFHEDLLQAIKDEVLSHDVNIRIIEHKC